MRLRHLLGAGALLLASAGWVAWHQAPRFPHARHAKLFPTCAGCHAGITTGDSARFFPTAENCAQCHNGRDEKQVVWSGPTRAPNNLAFSHTQHARDAERAGTPATCQSCHAREQDTSWMRVAGAQPTTCIGCHAHQAPEHLAETAQCATCHVPLAQARALPASEIERFPKPASHSRVDFISTHGPRTANDLAQCATCHARESCARCHPNAKQQPSILRLASDDRVAALVRGKAPVYTTPANHKGDDWALAHGRDAKRNIASCANCHAQPSCRSCHIGAKAAGVIAQLPAPAPDLATGIILVLKPMTDPVARPKALAERGPEARPSPRLVASADTIDPSYVQVHATSFRTRHAGSAASGRLDCMGCHQQRDCTACHNGASSSNKYHPADFLSRHPSAAYGDERNCSGCHRVETFCRSCHQGNGVASRSGTTGAAHTGQPLWLLQHGQAARQGLTSCTSCHQQRDCLRCHSDLGLHVNPHGPDFDASRVSARNKQMCATCHLNDPTQR